MAPTGDKTQNGKHQKANPRKRKAALTFHTAPIPPPEAPHHRHISYAKSKAGDLTTSTSIFHAASQVSEVDEDIFMLPADNDDVEQRNNYTANAPERDVEDDLAGTVDSAYLKKILEEEGEEELKRIRAKGNQTLLQWIPHCDVFLEELMNHEGRGVWGGDACIECGEPAQYECVDCGDRLMRCKSCVVGKHEDLFLHRLWRWNGSCFERASLVSLGLRKQLGHGPGQQCLNPQQCPDDDFWVIDIHGMQRVGIDFCGCGRGNQNHTIQLLRARLYPATVTKPKTAASFAVLEIYELISYESKASAFEFYQGLARLTDNTGVSTPKDRYISFLRMTEQWGHLKMLKRGGRGHDPAGVAATKEGALAVECPACPHPGVNMPDGWDQVPDDKRYLHARFFAIDANFRLKRKNVSSEKGDPGLSKGWAYCVNQEDYQEHLKKHENETEPKSTCSRHDAVNLSDAKPGGNYAASGVGKSMCARHGMTLPNSMGDLQVGERQVMYCNMDYLFYKSIINSKLKTFYISYDIACQWSINLKKRMYELDHKCFLFDNEIWIEFLVPKFHLPAHVSKCRTRFSFNFRCGCGRCDGEAPERNWAILNGLASSTREMGPGARRAKIDSHCGYHNWRTVTALGMMLKKKIFAAAIDMAEHVIEHEEVSSTISLESLATWIEQVKDWEADPTKPNPYEATVDGPTQAAVRRQLAEEEAEDIAAKRDFALDDTVSPSVYIANGLDIEAEQRAVRAEAKKVWDHAQDRQKTRLQLNINALRRKTDSWLKYQILYCPGAQLLRSRYVTVSQIQAETKVYDFPLWLPSQIQGQAPVSPQLQRIEWKLRYAQAHEALDDLRSNLQVRAYLYQFKDRFVRGQAANTRARNTISTIDTKIQAAAEEYRVAYNALVTLAAILFEFSWRAELLPLKDEDIRDLSEGKMGQSEGKRTMSWIWKTTPTEGEEGTAFMHDRLRVEWAKSRARAQRFTEEVELLTQEMSRVLRFFDFKAAEWTKRGKETHWAESATRIEGLRAYAERQAAMYRTLRKYCAALWADVPGHVSRMQDIIQDPKLAWPGEFDGSSAGKDRTGRDKTKKADTATPTS